MKTTTKKFIDVNDWDELVTKTYGKIYSFQQQEGCKDRGNFYLDVPSKFTEDEEMHESIPEIVNGAKMGVKFKTWLNRDPKLPIENQKYDWELDLFWKRNFYPDVYILANDLYEKGLLEKGSYVINIDW